MSPLLEQTSGRGIAEVFPTNLPTRKEDTRVLTSPRVTRKLVEAVLPLTGDTIG